MRASLLASATATSFGGLRWRRSRIQAMSPVPLRQRPSRTRLIRAVAPTTSTLRSASSPARVIPPSRTLPAVEWSLGVSPIQAANCRPDRNASGAGVFLVSNVAPIGPTPGICARRWLRSSARCQARSLTSTPLLVLGRVQREQLAGQRRQGLVGLDAQEQRRYVREA